MQSSVVTDYNFVDLNNATYYEFANPYSLGLDSTFSVELWFKPRKSKFLSYSVASQAGAWDIKVNDANTSSPYVSVQIGQSGSRIIRSLDINTAATANEIWNNFFYHVVFAWDGSGNSNGLKVYLNAVLPDQTTVDSTLNISINPDNNVIVGKDIFSYSQISIFSDTLSQSEVEYLYSNGRPIKPTNSRLVFHHSARENLSQYRFGEGMTLKSQPLFPSNLRYETYKFGNQNGITIHADDRFGMNANFALPNLLTSPVYGEWYSPFVWYDSVDDKTYFTTQLRGSIGFDRATEYLSFDHTTRELEHFPIRLGSINDENSDVHNLTNIIKTKDGYWLSGREDGHTSPIYVARTNDFRSFEELSVINTGTGAYANFFYLNDSLRAIVRVTANNQNDGQVIAISGDNGQSWSATTSLAQSENSFFWGYPGVFYYDESKVFSFYFARAGNGGNWQGIYCMASKDGRVWKSVDGSFSKNIYNNGHWVESELFSHGLVDSIPRSQVNPANTIDCIDVVIDSTNTPHVLYVNTLIDSTYYMTHNGSSWIKTTVNIPTWIGDYRATSALVWKGNNDFDLFKIETRNGYDVIVHYNTQNGFQTVTDQGVVSKPNKNYSQITRTHNAKIGDPFLILASEVQLDGFEGSYLWVYEYRF